MRRLLPALVLVPVLVACGPFGSSDGKGKEACETYKAAIGDDGEAITEPGALETIKGELGDLDDTTKRAFAALITAADANPFLPETDPQATDKAAAEVRTACLSEHSVDIPAPYAG